jgi:hypothetical protein
MKAQDGLGLIPLIGLAAAAVVGAVPAGGDSARRRSEFRVRRCPCPCLCLIPCRISKRIRGTMR